MKLFDIEGEKAIDALANVLESGTALLNDEDFEKMLNELDLRNVKDFLTILNYALKNHKNDILQLVSNCFEPENPQEYIDHMTLNSLFTDLSAVMASKEVNALFPSAEQTQTPSGSVTENIEEQKE